MLVQPTRRVRRHLHRKYLHHNRRSLSQSIAISRYCNINRIADEASSTSHQLFSVVVLAHVVPFRFCSDLRDNCRPATLKMRPTNYHLRNGQLSDARSGAFILYIEGLNLVNLDRPRRLRSPPQSDPPASQTKRRRMDEHQK